MKRRDFWKLSLLNVFAAPLRSTLTVLGFSIGVAAILAVITLGDAGRDQVEQEMLRLGIDKGWITASSDTPMPVHTSEWLEEATGISAQELVYLPVQVSGPHGRCAETTAIGCGKAYLDELSLKDGAKPAVYDWKQNANMVMVGEALAEQLEAECGNVVIIAGKGYTVCGILAPADGVTSTPVEHAVVLPVDTLCAATGGTIHEIQIASSETLSLKTAKNLAVNALESQGYDVSAMTMEVQKEAASSVIDTFVSVLGWVALVCILAGGIGIMNILLVSIRERRREIGVMKSMGATPVQICGLFLLEALIYAAIGGLLGILLGMGFIHAAGQSIDLPAKAAFGTCFTVFFCAIAAGAAFGALPALRASLLKCVDALRQE